ncbi:MAG: hypothetical protein GY796_31355, partial [Chloroflexi bacterium]|nr:hypothetical protein [Chloroflexota bacterium]
MVSQRAYRLITLVFSFVLLAQPLAPVWAGQVPEAEETIVYSVSDNPPQEEQPAHPLPGVEYGAAAQDSPVATDSPNPSGAAAPAIFIENVGQFDDAVRFQARGEQGIFHFTADGVWITAFETTAVTPNTCLTSGPHFPPQHPAANTAASGCAPDAPRHFPVSLLEQQPGLPDPATTDAQPMGVNLKLTFAGANPNPRLVGLTPLPTAVSYFIGADPANWHTNVPVYTGVRYEDVYPGIDIEYTADPAAGWQARAVAKPGADLSPVAWEVEGATAQTLTGNGQLRLDTAVGPLELPLLLLDETKSTIQPKPRLHNRTVRQPFMTIEQYQATATSDPYRTYLGGSDDDYGLDIAVDGAGSAYVVGATWSTDFHPIVTNTITGTTDIFVAKFNPDGDQLVYATYLGGSGHECDSTFGECRAGIAVDDTGVAYLTGATWSDDFPTPNGLDASLGGLVDAFVVKLNEDGNQLLYGTYLGGSQPAWGNADYGYDIAIDSNKAIIVTGETWSADFPLQSPFKNSLAQDSDAFVSKLTPTGDALVFSTYLGGEQGVNVPWGSYDYGAGVAVDGNDAVYITGWTASEDILIGIPFSMQSGLGGTGIGPDHCREEYWCPDAFVIKLDAAGTPLYGTYIGDPGWDEGRDIAVHNGEATMAGMACQSFDTNCSGLVTRLNSAGGGPVYSALIGGSGYDMALGVAVDGDGAAYVAGETRSYDFPATNNAEQPDNGGTYNGGNTDADAFMVRLNLAGQILYGTYLGGDSYERATAVAVQDSGVYVTGETLSTDFPTHNAMQSNKGGGWRDAFVARYEVFRSTISGTVLDIDDNPLPGVVISDTVEFKAISGSDGAYTYIPPEAGVYTLLPLKNGYAFTPTQRVVAVPPSHVDQDFIGAPVTASLTLSVTDAAG